MKYYLTRKKKEQTTDRNNKDELYKRYIKHKKPYTQLHLYKVQEGKINLWRQKLENHWHKLEHKEHFWVDQKIPYLLWGGYYMIVHNYSELIESNT